jgi:hypothetical protein
MSDESVKICNAIIQEEEYYSDIQGEYIAKKNNLNSKYKNSLIGVIVTCIFFIILIIIGIILLFIKNKKNKNTKNNKIDVKKIIALILFIIAFLCSISSIGLGYFTNKNKNDRDNLVEPVLNDKYRPCYSSAQKKLIIDETAPPKDRIHLGLDLNGLGIGGSLGTFTYSEENSNMQDISNNSLTSNQTRDKQSSYSGTTSSYYDTNASAGTNSSNTTENRRGNTNNSTSNASASSSGGTTSQVNLLI